MVDTKKKVPIGQAKIIHDGKEITIVSISGSIRYLEDIWKEKQDSISMEIIDVRTVVPLDISTIISSVKKTGRLVVCDTANRTGSLAGHISSLVVEKAFEYLKAPICIASCDDVPVPYSKVLEKEVLISKEKILEAIYKVYNYRR